MRFILFFISLLLSFSQIAKAQDSSLYTKPVDELNFLKWVVIDGDTLPIVNLGEVEIVPEKERTPFEQRKYDRMKRYIGKVYPYAHKAVMLLNEMEEITSSIEKKRTRKKYLRKLEGELKQNFQQDLKKLTVSQGKLLIKIIERETDREFYDILKELKNPVSAFFWQNLGKRYGYDLKQGYKVAENEDMEEIMVFLEDNGLDFLGVRINKNAKLEQLDGLPSVEEVLKKKKRKKKSKKGLVSEK